MRPSIAKGATTSFKPSVAAPQGSRCLARPLALGAERRVGSEFRIHVAPLGCNSLAVSKTQSGSSERPRRRTWPMNSVTQLRRDSMQASQKPSSGASILHWGAQRGTLIQRLVLRHLARTIAHCTAPGGVADAPRPLRAAVVVLEGQSRMIGADPAGPQIAHEPSPGCCHCRAARLPPAARAPLGYA